VSGHQGSVGGNLPGERRGEESEAALAFTPGGKAQTGGFYYALKEKGGTSLKSRVQSGKKSCERGRKGHGGG